MLGFDASGNPKYGSVNWQNSGGNISYTGGKVGIGTVTPLAKLAVSTGNIGLEVWPAENTWLPNATVFQSANRSNNTYEPMILVGTQLSFRTEEPN